jgi:hypothetical protein
MSSNHATNALLAVLSKAYIAVPLVLAVLLAAVFTRATLPAPGRLCAAGCALGLATLIGWRIALWYAPGNSSTGIGFPWYVSLLRVAVIVETGLAGYLATASSWRVCFLALAGVGVIRGLWIVGLTAFLTWQDTAGARQRRKG